MHSYHRSYKNKNTKQDMGFSSSNPFDDQVEKKTKNTSKSSERSSPEPKLDAPTGCSNPFGDDNGTSNTSSYAHSVIPSRNRYKNEFRDSGGFESQNVQELEGYAVYKSEETTKAVNSCLKIAEDMREDATKTLVTLHQQGEQITRTHVVAADMDLDLSRGEKLLGSLGGIFSKTWKPKKTSSIKGPVILRVDESHKRGNHLEQREKLGLGPTSKGSRPTTRTPPAEPAGALQKVEVEKAKQDDALSDICDILGELKEMALDMGSEIDIQNKALGHVQDDVDVINDRVLQTNRRARKLLGK